MVVITGASGDIGFAIARRFAAAGARLALLDRDGSTLESRSRGLAAQSAVFTAACDLADAAASVAVVTRIAAHYGAINVLVSNAAAVTPKNSVADLSLAEWQQSARTGLACKRLVREVA